MTTTAEMFRALGMHHTADNLDDTIALSTKKRFGPAQLLEHLATQETRERAERSLQRRITKGRIGRFKTMADFDWAWPKRIDRPALEAVLTLSFIGDARNVILVAPQGLGKTMVAQNIAHMAALKGHAVLFTTASNMLLDLGCQDTTRALERKLRHYCAPHLLVLDEIGYLSYDNRNADLLFQVVSRRYERKSILLTTNMPFAQWPTVFPNAACVTALIDRLVHHADILTLEGDSYRLRDAKADRKPKTK